MHDRRSEPWYINTSITTSAFSNIGLCRHHHLFLLRRCHLPSTIYMYIVTMWHTVRTILIRIEEKEDEEGSGVTQLHILYPCSLFCPEPLFSMRCTTLLYLNRGHSISLGRRTLFILLQRNTTNSSSTASRLLILILTLLLLPLFLLFLSPFFIYYLLHVLLLHATCVTLSFNVVFGCNK